MKKPWATRIHKYITKLWNSKKLIVHNSHLVYISQHLMHRHRLLEITVGRDFSPPATPLLPLCPSFSCPSPPVFSPSLVPTPTAKIQLGSLEERCNPTKRVQLPNSGAFSGWNLHNLCYWHNDIFVFYYYTFYCFKNNITKFLWGWLKTIAPQLLAVGVIAPWVVSLSNRRLTWSAILI